MGPVDPDAPCVPEAPIFPITPCDPVAPIGPVDPDAPVEPLTPDAPLIPVYPRGPVDPGEPTSPSGGPIHSPMALITGVSPTVNPFFILNVLLFVVKVHCPLFIQLYIVAVHLFVSHHCLE
jgi:hypothetical protein